MERKQYKKYRCRARNRYSRIDIKGGTARCRKPALTRGIGLCVSHVNKDFEFKEEEWNKEVYYATKKYN